MNPVYFIAYLIFCICTGLAAGDLLINLPIAIAMDIICYFLWQIAEELA